MLDLFGRHLVIEDLPLSQAVDLVVEEAPIPVFGACADGVNDNIQLFDLAKGWHVANSIGAVQVLGRLLLFFFEHHFDLRLANRLIPVLIPLGLAALLAGAGHPWAALLFVLLYGLGNGMLTIVKGTAIAQYVNRDHVASLNGALGVPTAVARALSPVLLGLLWSPEAGYTWGLWLLLVMSVAAALALLLAQRKALAVA